MALNNSQTTTHKIDSVFVSPDDDLQVLTHREIEKFHGVAQSSLYPVFRKCALAVLNCDSREDDTSIILEKYSDFDIKIFQRERGIKLELINAPGHAFVDGEIIKGIKEHLFAVLRDIVFIEHELHEELDNLDTQSASTTDFVFEVLRNARALHAGADPNLIVCWGGHSIKSNEYDYTKKVGYELGLRSLDICTGCGPGAMKGPMKGATIAHRKQRNNHGRYLGVSEPSIIAAESPNPIVNELVILPDIEKRLEAFVRIAHGIIVFPGGVGTAEEIFYLLGLMLHENNHDQKIPVIFTAPESSKDYFESIDRFLKLTLGEKVSELYEVIIDDPVTVAQTMSQQMGEVRAIRREKKDAFYFNWSLKVPDELQKPFEPTHENMASLNINKSMQPFELAVNLRAMFSGIVAGNVKESGIQAIEKHGNYKIMGDSKIMNEVDILLTSFVQQGRMKINAESYIPCYDIVR